MTLNTLNLQDKFSKKINLFMMSKENELTLNIKNLSTLEATRTALLNSAKCYGINPYKKINWIVKNEGVKNVITPFKLNNMEIITKEGKKKC